MPVGKLAVSPVRRKPVFLLKQPTCEKCRLVFSILCLTGLSATASDVFERNNGQDMEQATRALQAWGQGLTLRVSAKLQQEMVKDTQLRYEIQLTEQTVNMTEQTELLTGMNTDPALDMEAKNTGLAAVIPSNVIPDCGD